MPIKIGSLRNLFFWLVWAVVSVFSHTCCRQVLTETSQDVTSKRWVMKFIIVGSQYAGKSCILSRFTEKKFPMLVIWICNLDIITLINTTCVYVTKSHSTNIRLRFQFYHRQRKRLYRSNKCSCFVLCNKFAFVCYSWFKLKLIE